MNTPTQEEIKEAIRTLEAEFLRLQEDRRVLLQAAQAVLIEERQKTPEAKEFSSRSMRELAHAVQYIARG